MNKKETETTDIPIVKAVIMANETKEEVFGINSWRMSARAFEYIGPRGEALASFHAPILERYLNILEGVEVKLTVFDLNNKHDRFYIGFPSTCASFDIAVSMTNSHLDKEGIEKLPVVPLL